MATPSTSTQLAPKRQVPVTTNPAEVGAIRVTGPALVTVPSQARFPHRPLPTPPGMARQQAVPGSGAASKPSWAPTLQTALPDREQESDTEESGEADSNDEEERQLANAGPGARGSDAEDSGSANSNAGEHDKPTAKVLAGGDAGVAPHGNDTGVAADPLRGNGDPVFRASAGAGAGARARIIA